MEWIERDVKDDHLLWVKLFSVSFVFFCGGGKNWTNNKLSPLALSATRVKNPRLATESQRKEIEFAHNSLY